ERLEQRGALRPDVELVDVDPPVARVDRLLDLDSPPREVLQRVEASLLPRTADELLRDVALVEAVVRREDRVFAALPRLPSVALRLHQLPERREQVRLPEDLARLGRLPG